MHTAATLMTLAPDKRQAFLDQLEEHAGIIRKVAATYSRTHADRLDLMQEITLQLWKAWPRYSPERPFSTWMYRIALNVAISSLRRRTRPGRETVPLEEMNAEPASAPSPDPAANERVALLQQVIARLDPLSRALMMLYLDEHSYREIAATLGISETNVATKLQRLKQRVREEILKLTSEDQ